MVPEDALAVAALETGVIHVRDREGERPHAEGAGLPREGEIFVPLAGPAGEKGVVRLDARRVADLEGPQHLPILRSLLAMAVVGRFPEGQSVSEDDFGQLTSETRFALADLVGDHPAIREVRSMFREGGFPRFLFLTGEAGSGKRFLAQMAARRSRRRPFVIHLHGGRLTGPWESSFPDIPEGYVPPRSWVLIVSEIDSLPGPVASFLYRLAAIPGEDGAPALIGIGRELPGEGVFTRDAAWWEGRGRAFVLPPLRERGEDIRSLADYFLRRLVQEEGKPRSITPEAFERLRGYPWPGNVRELRNCIERMTIQSSAPRLDEKSLPDFLQPGSREALLPHLVQARIGEILDLLDPTLSTSRNILGEIVGSVERLVIEHGLRRCGGSQVKTAGFLGINRNTLREKLRAYGLLKERRRARAPGPPKVSRTAAGMPLPKAASAGGALRAAAARKAAAKGRG